VRHETGRVTLGGVIVLLVLGGLLVVWGLSRRERLESELKTRLIDDVSTIDGYDADRPYYLQLIEEAHEVSFGEHYRNRRVRSRKPVPDMKERYRVRAYGVMIDRARDDGREDIAVKLSRHRGKDRWQGY
jgi:hypothetical protein